MSGTIIRGLIAGFSLLALLPASASAQEYLCVPDLATGFVFKDNAWRSTNFEVERQYLIAASTRPKFTFEVTVLGHDLPDGFCEHDFNKGGYLRCAGIFGELHFNRKNGRYLISYVYGYYNVLPELGLLTDQTSSTPLIEIGQMLPASPAPGMTLATFCLATQAKSRRSLLLAACESLASARAIWYEI